MCKRWNHPRILIVQSRPGDDQGPGIEHRRHTGLATVTIPERSFQPSMKVSMAPMRSLTEVEVPRRTACRVMARRRSRPGFSHEPDVGGKCSVILELRSSHR